MHRSLTAVLAADVVGYSRLMNEDATATLANLRQLRSEIIGPLVAARRGRVVKSMGDGWIVVFGSVTDAVECAIQAQDRLNTGTGVLMRVGIHIGDVTEDDGDVFGDGVNIAARLQELADPGAVVVSAAVQALLDGTLRCAFADAGERILKNIPDPVRIWSRDGRPSPDRSDGAKTDARSSPRPSIRFARADDGTSLAYAVSGSGPGLIRIGHFPSHLELDWQEQTERALFDELGRSHTLIRFDQRGTGLSDLEIDEVEFTRGACDLAAVADAAGLERFVVFGSSGSGVVTAVHTALRYPDRVAGLILLGGCVEGRSVRSDGAADLRGEPIEAMLDEGWDTPDSPFLTAYISLYFPEAGEKKARELAQLIQSSCPKKNAMLNRSAMNRSSIVGLLGQVRAPTLVMHSRGDSVHPISQGRKLASGIANAEMVVLDSRNHYPIPGEPCWPTFCSILRAFLDADAAARS